ncbi:putative 3-isopropylmalate dehydratase [Coleophoma crateriformis]|uniref:Putative 3-isopropylmalate dehydratase n=1 Tax=Coleophoma crateriformis TaxID=565419 RepID=A0A3D8S3W6_9HELO|nr:putative 3-isopropylmalate dehydratase [Coleophoma crateriformis]
MPKSTIVYNLNGGFPKDAIRSIRILLDILAHTRGIVLDEQPKSEDLPSTVSKTDDRIYLRGSDISHHESTVSYLGDFLDRLCEALDTIGKDAEADAFRHALQLYQIGRERDIDNSGASNSNAQLKNEQFEDLEFLVEAWLEALNSAESARTLPAPLPVRSLGTRPMTLAEKIFAHHAFSLPSPDGLKSGELVRISIDWIIASELSWVGMKHSMVSIGEKPSVWRNDRFWLAGDHTVEPRTYDQPRVRELLDGLQDAKQQFKMTENQGSNYTILHTEFVRERAEPGILALGSDSHTCSAGAVSCLAIGLGAADVMAALATGETWIKVPESIRIEFTGEPAWYIRGKDVILYILKELKRNTYAADRIVEFGGPGAKYLSCDARFAITNMCTELGGVTGIFVPDEVTNAFVSARSQSKYKSNSLYFQPDKDASYAAIFQIDLNLVESFIALYPSPDNVVPVSEKLDMEFDGCFIGACTTTEEELVLGALVLEAGLKNGLSLAPGKRMVVPGSIPIVNSLKDLGLLDIYTQAGFEQPAVSCSLCLGMGADRAGEGENWLSSQNRNFKNRMGKGSTGHICSAATVAASSFSMQLTNPAVLLAQVSPDRYKSLLGSCQSYKNRTQRARASKKPNFRKTVPLMPPYVEPHLYPGPSLTGKGNGIHTAAEAGRETGGTINVIESKVYAVGDFVDTDAIIPAAFILESPTDVLLGNHALEFTNPDFRDKVRQGMRVVVGGKAFGCGSSREEAPRALKGLGVECVIAKSFSFIYGRNQPNIGLLGLNILDEDFYELARTGSDIKIDIPGRIVQIEGRSFSFALDDMELSLIKNRGLATAYKTFGKNVFASLCDTDSTLMVSELADLKLKGDGNGMNTVLAW